MGKLKNKIKGIWVKFMLAVEIMHGRKFIAVTFAEIPEVNYTKARVWSAGAIDPILLTSVTALTKLSVTNQKIRTGTNNLILKANEILQCPEKIIQN